MQDFELVSMCIAVERFSRWHTGVNIASDMTVLSNNAIDQSTVSAVIGDTTANMDLSLRLQEWRSRYCCGDTLQLATYIWWLEDVSSCG